MNIKAIYKRIVAWVQSFRMFAILDPRDNSVTLSKELFNHIRVFSNKPEAKVFVFSVGNTYGFTVNPDIEQPTALYDIQYNSKHQCIGFESLCPSVNLMLNTFNLPCGAPIKVRVKACKAKNKMRYYKFVFTNG